MNHVNVVNSLCFFRESGQPEGRCRVRVMAVGHVYPTHCHMPLCDLEKKEFHFLACAWDKAKTAGDTSVAPNIMVGAGIWCFLSSEKTLTSWSNTCRICQIFRTGIESSVTVSGQHTKPLGCLASVHYDGTITTTVAEPHYRPQNCEQLQSGVIWNGIP